MAHSAITKKQEKYLTVNYMIRAKLYKGLLDGKMKLGLFFDDEKVKFEVGKKCNYCGRSDNLAYDHIIPRAKLVLDQSDNLLIACKKCNSSKRDLDLLEWMNKQNTTLPILVLRRYLKLVIEYCVHNDLMEMPVSELCKMGIPFKLELLPRDLPCPSELILHY
jgi:hypothetical protein